MIDCQNLTFSSELSQRRINQFKAIFGEQIINKIIYFTLFLLGVDRETISKTINTPRGSVRSIIRAIRMNGITGFEGHRKKCSSFLPPPCLRASHRQAKSIEPEVSVFLEEENIIVNLVLMKTGNGEKKFLQSNTIT